MVGVGEIARRARGRLTHRLESLPILALSVHSACNCRCVMCDIWKANGDKREISSDELSRHVDAIRALRVRRVMLTGGEPLLHRNLWALCSGLHALGIHLTLVTTGLLIEHHAAEIASCIDTVVISLDGPRQVHDRIRRVPGGFDRIARGIMALRAQLPTPRLIARSVVQRDNAPVIDETVAAAERIGFDEVSFLAADVSSPAFNRPQPWSADRVAEVAVPGDGLPALEQAVARALDARGELVAEGFVAGGRASLERIVAYYRALAGLGPWPRVQCNAPWVSAVLEPGDVLRPCFFHREYGSARGGLEAALNSDSAIAFRKGLDVSTDDTCRRCVCSLNVALTGRV